MSGKIGQELRENEWLMSIKQRTNIPGGVCEFDVPSYHYWLHQGAELHRHDLEGWLAPFLPIRDGIAIMLRLLRESGKVSSQTAVQGVYQQMMAGRVAQMLRLRLSRDYQCVPEISANKYALNIRFTTHEGGQRPRVIETDVDFELTFCNL
jgi:cell division protein ZapD